MKVRTMIVAMALSLAGGCDEDGDEGDEAATGAGDCEEQPVVTYDTFGRGFLSTYCNGCHGGAVVDRQGAPGSVVFDTPEDVEVYADRILARTAPADGSAPTMPPVGGVTEEDRERLVIWLTCYR